ncbi:MAG TPA: hypothetical protein EYH28_03220, partial [Anaerolineaceae bacterium]|nr:hypothetical protein [Anaerolineaceae bacterium]
RDFLTKPPVIDEFIGAVRRAGKLAQEEREKQMALPSTGGLSPETLTSGSVPRGKVITVYAPKGGIGCTTVAVSLAAALSADDTPTVVMDAKLQFGDVALFLNQHGKHSILDLAPRADALDQEIVNQVLLKHESTGLRILAAPVRPEDAEQLNAEQLVHIIDFLRYSHDYIVVDTASALDEFTLAALEHSDVIVLLVAQDLMSIKDAALFLELLHKMEWPLERVMLAMTRYDKRINVSPERVADHLKMSVTAVIPEDLKAAWRAIQRGLPLVKVGGKAALGVMELARAVRRQLAQTVEAG